MEKDGYCLYIDTSVMELWETLIFFLFYAFASSFPPEGSKRKAVLCCQSTHVILVEMEMRENDFKESEVGGLLERKFREKRRERRTKTPLYVQMARGVC